MDYVGKIIDLNFIETLPNSVDACGENGEFHSYCFDGPIFKYPIQIKTGAITYKPLQANLFNHPTTTKEVGTKGFWFIDLILEQ